MSIIDDLFGDAFDFDGDGDTTLDEMLTAADEAIFGDDDETDESDADDVAEDEE